jgi:hypothetical protein
MVPPPPPLWLTLAAFWGLSERQTPPELGCSLPGPVVDGSRLAADVGALRRPAPDPAQSGARVAFPGRQRAARDGAGRYRVPRTGTAPLPGGGGCH